MLNTFKFKYSRSFSQYKKGREKNSAFNVFFDLILT